MNVKKIVLSTIFVGLALVSCGKENGVAPDASDHNKIVLAQGVIGNWRSTFGGTYVFSQVSHQYYEFFNTLEISSDSVLLTDYSGLLANYTKGTYSIKADSLYFRGFTYHPDSGIYVYNESLGFYDSLVGIHDSVAREFVWKCTMGSDSTLTISDPLYAEQILYRKIK